jgi:3-deoxy-manno-octulosonate cytidylyltransferase (CMP-KDO synthetase)
MTMGVLIVIPARYASTRFPGKPLVPLRGAGGLAKTLVERSYEAARAVRGVDRVVVATDDHRIATAVRGFGAEVVMTPETCRNGTERCAAAAEVVGDENEIVVNLQGDAPLTPPWFVEAIIDACAANADALVATPVLRCDAEALSSLLEDRRARVVSAGRPPLSIGAGAPSTSPRK